MDAKLRANEGRNRGGSCADCGCRRFVGRTRHGKGRSRGIELILRVGCKIFGVNAEARNGLRLLLQAVPRVGIEKPPRLALVALFFPFSLAFLGGQRQPSDTSIMHGEPLYTSTTIMRRRRWSIAPGSWP